MRVAAPELSVPALVGLVLAFWPMCSAATTPFVIETIDGLADDVGWFSSLELDALGNPHVGYLDNTLNDLKYARRSGGAWIIEIADGSLVSTFASVSLALDAQGNPHVSYVDGANGALKYARKAGGLWTIEIADGSTFIGTAYSSLALDAQGNPHISYQDIAFSDLRYARKSGGVWVIETADGSANSRGLNTSLALDANGNPHISYGDNTNDDLMYARKVSGFWTIEIADAGDIGQQTSLILDAQGNPHVSYQDWFRTDLKYARRSGELWTIETADDGSGNPVGGFSSLALDAHGNAHISYSEAAAYDLKYVVKSNGVWYRETADGSPNNGGQYSSLALDGQDNPHVSYLEAATGDLKYADAAVHVLSPAGGITWAVGSRQNIVWSGIGPVDVLISADGGTTYQRLETGITTSPLPIRVSHLPTRFARVRIEREDPLATAASDSFFTINATISLAKFDATRNNEGTRLTWESRPGPEADIRYRVERAGSGASFVSIADALDRGEFIDPSSAASSRYRLIAINGLGEEYALGETSVTGALAADRDIVAYPNPATGPIEILYRVPLDRPMDLSIYDLSGRKVCSLIAGRQSVGVQSVTWDRRDDAGRDVAAGTYFARLTSGDGFRATERITIVR